LETRFGVEGGFMIKHVIGILALGNLLGGCSQSILQHHIASADPLFGDQLDTGQSKCLSSARFMLELMSPQGIDDSDRHLSEDCKVMYNVLQKYGFGESSHNITLSNTTIENPTVKVFVKGNTKAIASEDIEKIELSNGNISGGTSASAEFKRDEKEMQRRRNNAIDALIAVSNEKCGLYANRLKTVDGTTNSSLGILAILTGGVGSIVKGADAARALAGSSSIISGSQSALNESWFSNQTIHVLVNAFQKAREKQRSDILNREICPITSYTVMHGIGDVIDYHESCSLLKGLSETSLAIERADRPGIEVMRRQLADLASIRDDASNLISASLAVDSKAGQAALKAIGVANTKLAEAEAVHAADPTNTDKAHDVDVKNANLLDAKAAYATEVRNTIQAADIRRRVILDNNSSNDPAPKCPYTGH
jgi:hypothetical protein